MQTNFLPDVRTSWPGWAEFLRKHRLEGFVAWALEAAGPLTVLGAQVLYFGGPLLQPAFSNRQIGAIACLLEDRSETQAFVGFLREEKSS